MTAEEVGAYIRLLCFQWEQGDVPDDSGKIARIAGIGFKRLGNVLEKFQASEGGGLRNPRLERVRSEREAYIKRQAECGRRGGRPKPNPLPEKKGTLSQPFPDPKGFESLPSPSPSPSPSPVPTPPQPPANSEPDPIPTLQPEPPASPSSGGFKLQPDAETPRKNGNGWHPTPEQLLVGDLFKRRHTTIWSDKERRAWREAAPSEEDIRLVSGYYGAKLPRQNDFRRRDLLTLLNNWRGETDRARKFCETHPPDHDTSNF